MVNKLVLISIIVSFSLFGLKGQTVDGIFSVHSLEELNELNRKEKSYKGLVINFKIPRNFDYCQIPRTLGVLRLKKGTASSDGIGQLQFCVDSIRVLELSGKLISELPALLRHSSKLNTVYLSKADATDIYSFWGGVCQYEIENMYLIDMDAHVSKSAFKLTIVPNYISVHNLYIQKDAFKRGEIGFLSILFRPKDIIELDVIY